MMLRFADCRLDLQTRCLIRGADEVPLTPKAFAMLRLLVEGRPRAFSKSELLEHVWPGVFVSEASLARVINELRAAVDDEASAGRIIRTIYG